MKIVEKELKLEMTNVFGGDGFMYLDEIEEVKLKRSKKRTIRRDIGIPQDKMFDEENKEVRQIEVNTFKKDEKGNHLLRLGGSHGKLWGTLKAAGHILCETEGTPSKAAINRIMETVMVEPDWVKLDLDGSEIKREGLAQVLNTIGKSQVVHFFDVIPKCKCVVTIKYPSAFEKTINKQLDYMQSLNTLNKRRARIRIIN
jgi:hypothetical protein